MVVIKKYSNRRLYDARSSAYITLDDLADIIRRGEDVRVVDAKTNDDLTQATLTQIILDSRGGSRLLPVELLTRLIRLDDGSLAEFLGRYVSWSLEVYTAARRGAHAVSPYVPFATAPFDAASALARLLSNQLPWPFAAQNAPQPPPPPPDVVVDEDQGTERELAHLRSELELIKQAIARKS